MNRKFMFNLGMHCNSAPLPIDDGAKLPSETRARIGSGKGTSVCLTFDGAKLLIAPTTNSGARPLRILPSEIKRIMFYLDNSLVQIELVVPRNGTDFSMLLYDGVSDVTAETVQSMYDMVQKVADAHDSACPGDEIPVYELIDSNPFFTSDDIDVSDTDDYSADVSSDDSDYSSMVSDDAVDATDSVDADRTQLIQADAAPDDKVDTPRPAHLSAQDAAVPSIDDDFDESIFNAILESDHDRVDSRDSSRKNIQMPVREARHKAGAGADAVKAQKMVGEVLAAVKRSNLDAQDKAQSLSRKLTDQYIRNEKLLDELDDNQKAYTLLEEHERELHAQVDAANSRVSELQDAILKLQSDKETREKLLNELKSKNASAAAETREQQQTFNASMESLNDKLLSEKSLRETAERHAEELAKSIEERHKRIEDLQNRLDKETVTINEQVAQLRDASNRLDMEKNRSKSELDKERAKAVKAANESKSYMEKFASDSIAQVKAIQEKLDTETSESHEQLDKLTSLLSTVTADRDSLRQQMQSMVRDNKSLQNMSDAMEAERDKLNAELDKQRAMTSSAKDSNVELSGSLAEVTSELMDARAKIDDVLKERDAAISEASLTKDSVRRFIGKINDVTDGFASAPGKKAWKSLGTELADIISRVGEPIKDDDGSKYEEPSEQQEADVTEAISNDVSETSDAADNVDGACKPELTSDAIGQSSASSEQDDDDFAFPANADTKLDMGDVDEQDVIDTDKMRGTIVDNTMEFNADSLVLAPDDTTSSDGVANASDDDGTDGKDDLPLDSLIYDVSDLDEIDS